MIATLVCKAPNGTTVVFSQASPGGAAAGFRANPSTIPAPPKTAGGRPINPPDYTVPGSNLGGQCAAAKAVLAANAAGLKPIAMTETWSGPPNQSFKEGKHAESCETCKKLLPALLCDK